MYIIMYKKEGILQVKLPAAHSWKHLELLNSNMLLPPSIDPSSTHHSSSFILRWWWWQQVEQGLQMFSSATPPGPPVESEALPDQMRGFEVSPEVVPVRHVAATNSCWRIRSMISGAEMGSDSVSGCSWNFELRAPVCVIITCCCRCSGDRRGTRVVLAILWLSPVLGARYHQVEGVLLLGKNPVLPHLPAASPPPLYSNSANQKKSLHVSLGRRPRRQPIGLGDSGKGAGSWDRPSDSVWVPGRNIRESPWKSPATRSRCLTKPRRKR